MGADKTLAMGAVRRVREFPEPGLATAHLPRHIVAETIRSGARLGTMMKRALAGIASVAILAVTVGTETANAQPYRRYGPARTYAPQAYPSQSRGSVPRGISRTVPFSDPNSPEATGGGSIGYNRGLPHNE